MPKLMRRLAALCLGGTVIAALLLNYLHNKIWLTLAITLGTTAYHLGIRLLAGGLFNAAMHNRADLSRRWYQPQPWEDKLYRLLRVREWKNKLPTYYPESFSPRKHSWEEIAQAMCQSELVHEVNMLLSFVPLLAVKYFGSFYVFLLTSIGAALFDLLFVIMQRYNRPRVLAIARRRRRA